MHSEFDEAIDFIKRVPQETAQTVMVSAPLSALDACARSDSLSEAYNRLVADFCAVCELCAKTLKKSGSLWVCCDNIMADGRVVPVPFDIIRKMRSDVLSLKSVIVWYTSDASNLSRDLGNRYRNFLLYARSQDYVSNIDLVREEHIWKDAEWGGGRLSRYNPKGKNPSNFWLKAISENGKILKHQPLSMKDVTERILLLSAEGGDTIMSVFSEFSQDADSLCGNLDLKHIQIGRSRDDLKRYCGSWSRPAPFVNPVTPRADFRADVVHVCTSEDMYHLPDNSVQVVVTSPPYWGLRDYGDSRQIGFDDTYSEYLSRLSRVWGECRRVLTDSGSLWVNINKRQIQGRLLVFPVDFIKDICELGFFLKDVVIWHRPISVPTAGQKGLTDRYEFILFFTKEVEGYFFDADSASVCDYRIPGIMGMGNVWQMHRKFGTIGKEVSVLIKDRKIKHTAVYPTELVSRVIKLCTTKGDVVLDPFAGSGTTLVVANKLGRRWVGYELNEDYADIISYRMAHEGLSLSKWD